jgi:cytochrome c
VSSFFSLSSALGMLSLTLFLGVLMSGCEENPPPKASDQAAQGVARANQQAGAELIVKHGCGNCHIIPGIPGANGVNAPSLAAIARRSYLAGRLPNRPENLVKWIRFPREINKNTSMPTVGLSEQEAFHVAAYLRTLK